MNLTHDLGGIQFETFSQTNFSFISRERISWYNKKPIRLSRTLTNENGKDPKSLFGSNVLDPRFIWN